MHHIVFPPPLVVAPILEDVLALAVLQIVFLLTDVLAPVCILLVHIHQLLLVLDRVLPPFAELPICQ